MKYPVLPKDPEEIRKLMIKWHGEREADFRLLVRQALGLDERLHFWALADVHDSMEQFWQEVVFEDLSK